jgi:hypothetical protein
VLFIEVHGMMMVSFYALRLLAETSGGYAS